MVIVRTPAAELSEKTIRQSPDWISGVEFLMAISLQ